MNHDFVYGVVCGAVIVTTLVILLRSFLLKDLLVTLSAVQLHLKEAERAMGEKCGYPAMAISQYLENKYISLKSVDPLSSPRNILLESLKILKIEAKIRKNVR